MTNLTRGPRRVLLLLLHTTVRRDVKHLKLSTCVAIATDICVGAERSRGSAVGYNYGSFAAGELCGDENHEGAFMRSPRPRGGWGAGRVRLPH